MFKIDPESKQISITRGDIASLDISVKNTDGTDYVFNVGDVVRFNVCKKKDFTSIVISKEIKVDTETTSVNITLNKQDTKIGEVINKPTEYWYEVELNPKTTPQTIIGYDEDGAKIFMLYPEGSEE